MKNCSAAASKECCLQTHSDSLRSIQDSLATLITFACYIVSNCRGQIKSWLLLESISFELQGFYGWKMPLRSPLDFQSVQILLLQTKNIAYSKSKSSIWPTPRMKFSFSLPLFLLESVCNNSTWEANGGMSAWSLQFERAVEVLPIFLIDGGVILVQTLSAKFHFSFKHGLIW